MSWEIQGRQEHGWFGHGTGPQGEKGAEPAQPNSLFDPKSVNQRIDYVKGGLIGHAPRAQRAQWESRVSGANRESLRTAFAVWYGASRLSRDAFRQQLLDPYTSDETVDRLRSAAKGIVEGRSYAQLGAPSDDFATAALAIGLDRWPQFLGNAERRGIAAVSDGAIPGVIKASATGTDMGWGLVGAATVGAVILFRSLTQDSGPARPSVTPSTPTLISPISPTDDKGRTDSKTEPAQGANPHLEPGPEGVVVSDEKREYILNGNSKGTGGGHGPGRNLPNKSEFPPGWSDDQIIDAIKDVGNDPKSSRNVEPDGRIAVRGTRNGVDIRIIVEPDKKTVVSAYPTNMPRNPKREQ